MYGKLTANHEKENCPQRTECATDSIVGSFCFKFTVVNCFRNFYL